MKIHTSPAAKQRGFSILTGFILAIIMFGSLAFFLAGRGINTGFGATYSNTSKVAGLLASAGYIGTGFDAVKITGTEPTFDAAATSGIFNPSSGGSSLQPLDPNLFVRFGTVDGYWIYRKDSVKMLGLGTTTNEYTIMVSGLKLDVCKQINATLHTLNVANPNPPPLTGIADAGLFGAPVATAPGNTTTGATDLTAGGAQPVYTSGWMNGCFVTTDSNYVFIQTLLAQ